jgi:hypothetical protein
MIIVYSSILNFLISPPYRSGQTVGKLTNGAGFRHVREKRRQVCVLRPWEISLANTKVRVVYFIDPGCNL